LIALSSCSSGKFFSRIVKAGRLIRYGCFSIGLNLSSEKKIIEELLRGGGNE